MANIPGTIVADPISIGNTAANLFGSHYAFQGIGGAYEVKDIAERNAIPMNPASGVLNPGDPISSGRRRLGMTLYVIEENKYYKLYDANWNTYTSDLERYNSLADNTHWVDALNDLYLPIAGGNMAGPIGLIDGSYNEPAVRFNNAPGTGFYYGGDGLHIASGGRDFAFTQRGLETFNSETTTMVVGEGNTASGNYSYVYGSYSEADNFVTTAIGTVVKAKGQYATIVGSFSDALGDQSTTVGLLSTSNGFRSTALGNNLWAGNEFATVVGGISSVSSAFATTIGTNLTIVENSPYSALLGTFLTASQPYSVVIGTGIDSGDHLENSQGNSIYFGVNSTVPSFYVEGGNGTPGSLGKIGANITDPIARFEIKEGNAQIAPFRLRKNQEDKLPLAEGEFQFSTNGRIQFSPNGSANESIAYLSDLTSLSGEGTTSPLTTKGDLWGFSNTDIRIPIGPGFLAADPLSDSGVSWRYLLSGDITTALNFTPEDINNKGIAGGYCDLDLSGRIPLSRIPQSLLGATIYQGTWDAQNNAPQLTSAIGTKGFYYVVNNPGSVNLDGITDWKMGDWAIYNGSKWEKVDNTDALISFNNRVGPITLLNSDVISALGYVPYNSSNPAGYITDVSGKVNKSGDILTGTLTLADNAPLLFPSGDYVLNPPAGLMEWVAGENLAFTAVAGNRRFLAFSDQIPFVITGSNNNSIRSIFGNNTATGDYSLAIGSATKAAGANTFSSGTLNSAYGDYSEVFGSGNVAAGSYSHAEGSGNKVHANAAHAEGQNCIIGNQARNFSIAGTTVTIPGDVTLEFQNSFTAFFFNLIGGTVISYSRVISNTVFSGGVTTFTVNSPMAGVIGGQCVVPLIGQFSHAEGSNTLCKGTASHAEGNSSQALGNFSHAEGNLTIASGFGSHAEGNTCTASGYFAHAQGSMTTASGQYAHSEGAGTLASGGQSHAEGNATIASGWNAHAEGENTISSGMDAHSEGGNTQATYNYTHAGGLESVANKHAQFSRSGGKFTVAGDAQYSQLYAKLETTDNTIQELTLNTIDKLTIPPGKVWGFVVDLVAKQVGGTSGTVGSCAFIESKGLIKNINGTTTLVGENTTILQRDAGVNTWSLTVSANNANGSLRLQVTGQANKTIRWFATIHLYEVA